MFDAFSKLFAQTQNTAEETKDILALTKIKKAVNHDAEPNVAAINNKNNGPERHGPDSTKREYFMDPTWKRDPANALSNLKSLSQKQGQERKFLRPTSRNRAIVSESSAAQITRVESEKLDAAPEISPERRKKALLDLLNINGDHHSITA